MTDAEIIEYYDSHWNVTLDDMARLSGKSRAYIKELLLNAAVAE